MKIQQAFMFAGIAVVATALVLIARDRRRQERAIADLRQDVTALASTGEIGSTRASSGGDKLAAYMAMAAVATAKERETEKTPPLAKQLTPEQQVIEARERYEAAYTHDPPDPVWAAQAREIADRKLPGLLPEGSRVRAFDCRAELCRLETSHKDMDSYMAFIHSAFLNTAQAMWKAGTYSTPLHNDLHDGFMVTYIAREGHDLPHVVD